MGISTHILDTHRGKPAAGVTVSLAMLDDAHGRATAITTAITDIDGRLKLLTSEPTPGFYRIRFETAAYFEALGERCLYPLVDVTFAVAPNESHYHVPLLVTANSYSTYRGS